MGKNLPWERLERLHDDKYIPLDPSQGVFCYLLALAVCDNGGGLVVGTEMLPSKVVRAREHLQEAGLSELVEVRDGNALETRRNLDPLVDFLLNDGFPPYALEVLKLVAPKMRAGAVVFTDNVGMFKGDHVD